MRIGNTESRIPYLALALLSQKVIDSLVRFTEEGTKPKTFQEPLAEALKTLKAADTNEHGASDARYQHLRTIIEAWPGQTRSKIISNLEALLNLEGDVATKQVLASSLIENFSKLENRALSHFEHPRDSLPKGIRALCQVP